MGKSTSELIADLFFFRMRLIILLLLLIGSSRSISAQLPGDSIKVLIKREVAARRSKSIIVGIVSPSGRQIFSEGSMSDDKDMRPDSNTVYEIGSITKIFTSLLLADMSLRNEVDVNDPVSKYLPADVKTPSRNGKQITLLSLSTNRSGLPRDAYNINSKDPDNPYADYTEKELYEFISNYELSRDVNERWSYSNIGYSLLGHVLTIAAKRKYETLLNERICRVLKLRSTFLSAGKTSDVQIAQGHTECGQPTGAWDFPLPGGGGLRSNMSDMLAFAAANLGLIKSDLLQAMKMTHILQAKKDGNDTYTTMGWTLWNQDGKYLLFKDGGTGGYRTFLGIDTNRKVGVVVLSSSNNSVADIGWHILDPSHKVEPYKYTWWLLDTLRSEIKSKGVDGTIALYERLKTQIDSSLIIFNEAQLNNLGREMIRQKRIDEAIKIFELNLKEYPKSVTACESLAEGYKYKGDYTNALTCFKKALELDPQNLHFSFMIDDLKEK
jgi:D-alanyl-D-alanine-carboxypeptidase/D-alanyl-D-alanine-endopeptidase